MEPESAVMKISAVIITFNEEDRLPDALASLQGVADEVVVVDSYSGDRTVEIARQFGAKVDYFEWCDDFAAARKAGVATVRSPEGGFPRTRRELWEYDVLICSDVDIEYFTKEQIESTVDFVERHGGGYCMIGGYTAFGTGGYDESPIDKMLPVDMQGRQDGYTENAPFRWRITEDGWRHPIMPVSYTHLTLPTKRIV